MASIAQPTRTSTRRRRHPLLLHGRAVWWLLLIVSLIVVGIGVGLPQGNAAEVTTPTPLATAYDDVFFSVTSGHTQPRPRVGTTVLQEQEEIARDARDAWLSITEK